VASVASPVVASVALPVVASVPAPADEPSAPAAFAFPELNQAIAFAESNQAAAVPEPNLAAAFPESNLAAVLHETTLSDIPEGVPHPAYERMMAAGLDTELEFGDDELDAEPEPRRRLAGAALLRAMRQRRPIVVFGIVAAALLIGAVALRARTNGELYASDYSTDAQREAALMAANSGVTRGQPPVTRTSTAASPAVPNRGAVVRPAAPRTASNMQRVVDGDVTRSSDPTPSQPAPAAPPKLIGNLDAIAGAVKAPAASLGESTRTTLAEAPKGKFDLGVADGSNELVRAQLIGAAPVPKFPEILRDRKIVGDVVVRFTVDAQGRPDPASITVIRTPHELMTEAVRRVIPSLRFEPAHKGRIGAPAEADQVQMAFQFNGATN
jgi:TonB family protein